MFNKASISDYYRAVSKSFEETILKSDNQYLLNTNTEQIVSELMSSKHPLQPINLVTDKKESITHRKELRNVPASRREFSYGADTSFEYEVIDLTFPISSNQTIYQIKDLATSTFSMSWTPKDFILTPTSISLSLDIKGYGFKFEDDKIINEISNLKKRVTDWIGWVNGDIEKETQILKTSLTNFINDRKSKLSSDVDRIGGLSDKLGITINQG